MAENKVLYGFNNLVFFPVENIAGNKITYGTAVPVPGAVQVSLKPIESKNTFPADNTIYWVGNSSGGYEGDLEIARITYDVLEKIYQVKKDKHGVYIENLNDKTKQVGIAFTVNGDASETVYQFPLVTLGKAPFDTKTIDPEKGAEPVSQTISITVTANPRGEICLQFPKDSAKYGEALTKMYETEAEL